MSHNFYAEIPDEEREAYYDADHPKDPEEIDGYPYSKHPTFGVKVIRDSDWLPDHLTDGVWGTYNENQIMMYADALQRACGAYPASNDRESNEMARVLNIINWMRYWSDQSIEIRGAP